MRAQLASLVVALGFFASCRAKEPDLKLNVPYGTPPVASASASSSTRPKWAHLDELSSFAKANTRRFPSAGHFFGRYDADIVVSDDAIAAYKALGPGRALPVGALVAKVHHVAGAEDAGPILAMEKLASGWSYVDLDVEGRVIRMGRLEPCLGCHEQVSAQDELFGVPTTGR
ncbi:MAG: hypothetical protein ABI175_24640 [Polyangiales bacterium]